MVFDRCAFAKYRIEFGCAISPDAFDLALLNRVGPFESIVIVGRSLRECWSHETLTLLECVNLLPANEGGTSRVFFDGDSVLSGTDERGTAQKLGTNADPPPFLLRERQWNATR